MISQPTCNADSRGIILIVVLWVIAIMTVIVVALSSFAQKNVLSAGVETNRLRSELALQAGLDVGEAIIAARLPEERIYFDGSAVAADIGDGRTVEISVLDAAGLVDINRADPELLSAVMSSQEIPGPEAKVLIDEIVKLRQARQGAGADEQQQQPQGNQQPPRQQPQEPDAAGQTENKTQVPAPAFFSTAQLYGLDGADPAIVDKILPFISLYTIDGKINPMAAPEAILQSIPGITLEEIATLVTARERRQWKDSQVQDIVANYEKFLAAGNSQVFVIGVRALSGRGIIAGSRLRAVVIADEAGSLPFQTLAWSW